jgi:hypothetical protein
VCRFSRHPLERLRWAVVHRLGQVRHEQWLRLRLLPVSLPRCMHAGKMQRTSAGGLQRCGVRPARWCALSLLAPAQEAPQEPPCSGDARRSCGDVGELLLAGFNAVARSQSTEHLPPPAQQREADALLAACTWCVRRRASRASESQTPSPPAHM